MSYIQYLQHVPIYADTTKRFLLDLGLSLKLSFDTLNICWVKHRLCLVPFEYEVSYKFMC